MAKVMEGARASFSGKADGVVYVRLNGEVYTRKLPKRKKEAWTPGMIKNLERFKQVNAFCSLFKESLIPQIWKGVNPRMSGYALFLKTNMAAFAADGTIADAKKLMLSTGILPFPQDFEAKRSQADPSQIEVSWPKEMHVGGVHLKDELMVIGCKDGEYSDIINTGIERKELGGTFTLSSFSMPIDPSPMLLYLFFASANRRDYSPSECFEV